MFVCVCTYVWEYVCVCECGSMFVCGCVGVRECVRERDKGKERVMNWREREREGESCKGQKVREKKIKDRQEKNIFSLLGNRANVTQPITLLIAV